MALRELLAFFKVDVDTSKLTDANFQLGETVAIATAVGNVIGNVAQEIGAKIGEGIRAIAGLGPELVEQAADLNDSAVALGTTTQALQEMGYTAILSGLSVEEMNSAIGRLNRSMQGATDGSSKELAKALKDLDIDTKQFTDSVDLFQAVGAAIGEIEDPYKRAAVAAEFFGKSSAKLLPLFAEGEEGIEKLREEAQNLGFVFDGDFVDASAEVDDNLDRISFGLRGVATTIISLFLPYVRIAVEKLVEWVKTASEFIREHRQNLLPLLISIATVIAGSLVPSLLAAIPALKAIGLAGWAALRPLIPWIAAIALLVLGIEDLIGFVTGADSVTGRFLDTMFGAGTAAAVLEGLQALWWAIGQAIAAVMPYLEVFFHFLVDNVAAAWPAVKQAAEAALRFIGRLIQTVGEALGDFVFWLVNAVPNAWQAVKNAAADALGWIEQKIASVFARAGLLRDAFGKLASGDLAGAAADYQTALARAAPPGVGVIDRAGVGDTRTVTDQSNTTVNVYGAERPTEVGNAVRSAVQDVRGPNLQALAEAVG